LSIVFFKKMCGERPESPLFTPCFRLSTRPGLARFNSP
jgi:hypothetical protein